MEKKKCQVCEEEKSLDRFFDKGKGKDDKCKDCRLAYNRDRYAKIIAPHTKKYTNVPITVKVCNQCDIEKSVSKFNLSNSKSSGPSKYRGECKLCQKLWRKENKDKLAKSARLYRINNAQKIKDRKKDYLSDPENLEKNRQCAREYYKNNPERGREIILKRYGITAQQYDEILKNQDCGCAICGTNKNGRKQNFAIDHDHKSGVVRGLLCTQCNAGLGNYRDNPDLLRKAATYLEDF